MKTENPGPKPEKQNQAQEKEQREERRARLEKTGGLEEVLGTPRPEAPDAGGPHYAGKSR